MTEHGFARRLRSRRGAAIAASVVIAVAIGAVWMAGNGAAPSSVASGGSAVTTTSPPSPDGGSSNTQSSGRPVTQPAVKAQPAGLRLSAGQGQPAAPVAVVDGKPLDSKQIASIVDRLPALVSASGLAEPFRWPAQTIKKPQAGQQVPLTFPGTGSKTPPDPTSSGPMHVLRMQPQGPVSVAPFASITFDRPMVPVTTIGQLAATDVPATITPELAGTWQWIGTSTLRFAADSTVVDRLPMATTFTLTVPAGTRASDGSTLTKAATTTFSTPGPSVKHFQPTGTSMKLNPVFVAVFDQQVDPAAVLAHLSLTVGSVVSPVRLATAAEVAADPGADQTVSAAVKGRVVAFRSVQSLPTDEAVAVIFQAGTPSAEGPHTTPKIRPSPAIRTPR